MSRSRYERVSSDDDYFIIKDVGHGNHLSVTNDAEDVVKEVALMMKPGQKLLYYDSDGNLDELKIENGEFAGFAPGPQL